MTETHVDIRSLDAQARDILRGNDRGGYTIPTAGLYPYQWNWDSAFAAWGWARFDRERAWVELETLFTGQWDTGMLPHIVFHRDDPGYFPGPAVWAVDHAPPTSGITQPPVVVSVVRWLLEQDPEGALPRATALFPRLRALVRWFLAHRCEAGAVATVHPWESGRDNAADWDGALPAVETAGITPYTREDTAHVDASMRPSKLDYDRYVALLEVGRNAGWDEATVGDTGPFRVLDPGLTFILLRACRDLRALARHLNEPVAEIDDWLAILEGGVDRLWNADGQYFDAYDLRAGRFAGSLSSASFLCWYGGVDRPAMRAHLARQMAALPHGVASLDPEDPRFDARRYWRGPIWGVVNCLIALGLRDMSQQDTELKDFAETIRRDTADLIRRGGFHEYFNPTDGTPAGGGAFSWTAAIWLSWASPSLNKRTES